MQVVGVPLQHRIGINVGEVLIRATGESGGKHDLFGIQIDTCARVMSLAKGGQILMTRSVFDSARQVLKGEKIEGIGPLSWVSHGHYLLKGGEEPIEIFEVAERSEDLDKRIIFVPNTGESRLSYFYVIRDRYRPIWTSGLNPSAI